MKVIKRSRRTEDFDIDKVRITLIRAAEEGNILLNNSDIELLIKLIKKKIFADFNGMIYTREVKAIILEELRKLGFNNLANLYENYIKQ